MSDLLRDRLRALREKQGLSREQLSSATVRPGYSGVQVGTITSLEKYVGRVPDAGIIEALAVALGTTAEQLAEHEYPIAVARRDAKPSVTRRAKEAAQRLDDTPATSPRKRRAQDGKGGAP